MAILRDEKEMLRKLNEVISNGQLNDNFYPRLQKHAGKDMEAFDIVVMIRDEIIAFLSVIRVDPTSTIAKKMFIDMPKWIDAVVNDPKVAEEAKKITQEITEGVLGGDEKEEETVGPVIKEDLVAANVANPDAFRIPPGVYDLDYLCDFILTDDDGQPFTKEIIGQMGEEGCVCLWLMIVGIVAGDDLTQEARISPKLLKVVRWLREHLKEFGYEVEENGGLTKTT